MIKANKLSNHNSWITSGIETSSKHKKVLCIELRNNTNPTLRKYFKDYCQILSKVIKEAKGMECDRHISNSNYVMRNSWKLINKELGKDHKNDGIQSVNINGRSTSNHKIIADASNMHFTTIPDLINQNINANYCLIKTSVNNHNKPSSSLKHVFQSPFPSIKYHCTTTKETEYIIMCFKSSNSCGHDEVPTKLLKLYSPFFSLPLNYTCNRTLYRGVFPDVLKCAIVRPLFKKDNKNYMSTFSFQFTINLISTNTVHKTGVIPI